MKQELNQWKLKHTEANKREKGISLQLQDELKNKATLLEKSNYLSEQLKEQELIFLQKKEQLSKAQDEALAEAELTIIVKNKAKKYKILKNEFDAQEKSFHRLNLHYKE